MLPCIAWQDMYALHTSGTRPQHVPELNAVQPSHHATSKISKSAATMKALSPCTKLVVASHVAYKQNITDIQALVRESQHYVCRNNGAERRCKDWSGDSRVT
jgi:hypothetical protein